MIKEQAKLYVICHSEFFTSTRKDGPFKIGITQNVQNRIKQLQHANAKQVEVLWLSPEMDRELAYAAERLVHELLREFRKQGEWFVVPQRLLFQTVGAVKFVIEDIQKAIADSKEVA